MKFNVVPIGSICRLEKKLITPIEGVNYTLFSLPAFDNNKIPEKTDGKDIKSSKFVLEPNTILYNKLNVKFRRVWNIGSKVPDNSICSTEFFPLKVNSTIIQDYLYYFLCSDEFTERMNNLRKGTSNSQQRIDINAVFKYDIPLPDLMTQNKIATILSSIDKKIEINDAINQNLEQQLDALYKSWFVDLLPFDGMTPSSWKYGKLKDVLKQKRDSVKPGLYTNLPYLPIDSIPMNSLALNEVRPNEEALSSLVKFAKNDILIGAMRVYFHRVALAPFDGITRTTCFTLEPYNTNYLSFALLVCNQDTSIEYAQKTSKGSTMPYAIWDGGLGDMELLIPSEDDATRFNELALPLLSKIQSSYFENARLQNLRDILLPKLMSGELDVSELDI